MTGPFDLTGKVALVTGANKGIGAGIAVALAEAGADVIGVSRSMADDGGVTADSVRAAGRAFIPLRADLSTGDQVRGVIDRVDELEKQVDILVSNAGLANRAPAEGHSDEQWDEVIAVNLSAGFRLARGFGSKMLQRGTGKILFIASMMSFQGGRDVVGYAASKSGVVGIVHALANEWAARGVNVNAIAPGYIETELTAGTHSDPARRAAFTDRIPAGKWGVPADLGGAAVFLCSRASDYVHGAVLPVDGGWLAR